MSVQPMVSSASEPVIPGQDRGRISGWIHAANRYPIIPGIIMLFMMIAAVFAPLVAPHDPLYGYLGDREIPPIWYPEGSITHIMGTDQQGRDMLSRVIFGARISVFIVVVVVAIGGTIGTALGIIAAWYGRHVDELIMRAVDFTLAVPFILVALVAVIVFGQSMTVVVVLLTVFSWNGFARQIRADSLRIKAADYVSLAQVAGSVHVVDHVEAHLPWRYQHFDGGRHSAGRFAYPGRSHSQLPGRGYSAADPRMGCHGGRRQGIPGIFVVDRILPRTLYIPARTIE